MADSPMNIDHQYLTLKIDSDPYAIAINFVKEVLTVPVITRIPKMPTFMRGIINLRGAVVPIIDLKHKFGFGDTILGVNTTVIVVEINDTSSDLSTTLLQLGIFADEVDKVMKFDMNKVQPTPRIGTKIETEFLNGIAQLNEVFYPILNIPRILSQGDIKSVENIITESNL